MKRPSKSWWFWTTVSVAVCCLGILACCWYWHVWSLKELRVYRAMAQECHPVWHELHFSRIRAGDPVEAVISSTKPVWVKRTGEWVVLKYEEEHPGALCFTGVTVVAYDGRLVGAYAWSCTWVRQFFDVMSDEQRIEFFRDHYDQPARVGNAMVVRG
ncbi:MAG TPA: hypothetical protein VH682_21085 [Gemmataceae bacterium]|jgi:hypothetical protein